MLIEWQYNLIKEHLLKILHSLSKHRQVRLRKIHELKLAVQYLCDTACPRRQKSASYEVKSYIWKIWSKHNSSSLWNYCYCCKAWFPHWQLWLALTQRDTVLEKYYVHWRRRCHFSNMEENHQSDLSLAHVQDKYNYSYTCKDLLQHSIRIKEACKVW